MTKRSKPIKALTAQQRWKLKPLFAALPSHLNILGFEAALMVNYDLSFSKDGLASLYVIYDEERKRSQKRRVKGEGK